MCPKCHNLSDMGDVFCCHCGTSTRVYSRKAVKRDLIIRLVGLTCWAMVVVVLLGLTFHWW
jgi:hypothetical protein